MASTTPNADFINPILESDEISSEALAPVLEALQKWESEDDVESLRSASNKFWIATRDGIFGVSYSRK